MTERTLDRAGIEGDVVIIGAGGAGASAAIVAHDAGAKVILLEKMPEPGGNTHLSSASWFCPSSDAESQAKAIRYTETLCLGNTDREVVQAYVEEATKTKTWIEALGGTTRVTRMLTIRYPQLTHPSWPNFPGAEAQVNYRLHYERDDERFGQKLWDLLSANLERRGIKIMCSTPARELVTNQQGEVVGVIAERDGQRISIKAKRAVILTCGGFEYNDALKERYLPFKPIYPIGNPGNTGDGITMAQKVGAAMWHMRVWVGGLGFKAPEFQASFGISFAAPAFIYVNKDGKRFANELGQESHFSWQALCYFDPKKPGYPTIPVYGICDRETLRKGPLGPRGSGLNRDYPWSLDNSAEIAKGWIKQGKTIRELARQISVDEAALENTIAKYNECCKTGVDADLHRAKETMEPLKEAPYYAIELWPRMVNTMGGPRRDGKAKVISTGGQPILRLYSAGELGSLWGFLYAGGGNVGEVLAVGRIAGRNAAAEKPWMIE
ncbi:MAG: FAD-dependent oxidoreductase [Chloroflexi bacterium]|nr:FAD-dependent oxidoreductase [Chloroflexota bacterium]